LSGFVIGEQKDCKYQLYIYTQYYTKDSVNMSADPHLETPPYVGIQASNTLIRVEENKRSVKDKNKEQTQMGTPEVHLQRSNLTVLPADIHFGLEDCLSVVCSYFLICLNSHPVKRSKSKKRSKQEIK
ncbi:hypothetical protein L9F63_014122, partial [Diploptera punctata]